MAVFQLVVVVCMSANACETVQVPLTYQNETRCAEQAAIVAGMVRGRLRTARPLSYEYSCTPTINAPRSKGQVASKER